MLLMMLREETRMDGPGLIIIIVTIILLSSPFWILYLNKKRRGLGFVVIGVIFLYFIVGYIVEVY